MSLAYTCDKCRRRSVLTSRYDKKYPTDWFEIAIEYLTIDLCPACTRLIYKQFSKKLFDIRSENRNE